jgi:CO/xanthine dehydrogenase Mo-binding subunit
MLAARELKQALLGLAAQYLGVEQTRVQLSSSGPDDRRGCSFICSDAGQVTLQTLLEWTAQRGEMPLTRTATYTPKPPAGVTCFAAQVAEVEVDPETGQVRLRKLVTAHDVGKIINPLTHQGQIEGGIVQGIGQSLTEHLVVRDGAVTSLNLGDYKLPTTMDITELTTVLVETNVGPAPYAGKAIGEMSNVAVPAAIANAVFDAIGLRLTELPITAERVYAALQAQTGEKQRET